MHWYFPTRKTVILAVYISTYSKVYVIQEKYKFRILFLSIPYPVIRYFSNILYNFFIYRILQDTSALYESVTNKPLF